MSEQESSNNSVADSSNYRLPSQVTIQHTLKLAIVEDRPIMMNWNKVYW